MAIRKKTSTTRLPQGLLEQLGESGHDHSQKLSRPRFGSRKDARKQGREERKQKKANYFSHPPNARKRPSEEEHTDSPQRKRLRPDNSQLPTSRNVDATVSTSLPSDKPQTTVVAKQKFESSAAPTISSKPSKHSDKSSSAKNLAKQRPNTEVKSRQTDEEDSYIAYLEAQLGLGKGKKKAKASEDDGLDDLMDWADAFMVPSTSNLTGLDEYEESTPDMSASGSESDTSADYDDEEEWTGIVHEDPAIGSTSNDRDPKEDHTGSSTTGTYVPPHLRNAKRDEGNTSETIQKLTRQLKGLLNRMSEQNIGTIITSIEELYRDHRRNDVTSTLTTLIIDGISNHSSLLDSFVVLYAAFVACLHKIIGIEFAAHFVQNTVASYERYYAAVQQTILSGPSSNNEAAEPLDGKECSNLLILISELYNFQVISSVLVFDVIRALLDENLTEFKVELLLKIMRNSGQQLTQDDPSALKDIIQIVQTKITANDGSISSRTTFMVETLSNLKNNKLKRNEAQNQGGPAVERMKKFISGLSKTRHVLSHEPLRVSLDDLHSAESKGKWWLVGAAWGGDPLIDKLTASAKKAEATHEEKAVHSGSADLIRIARSQGMNTDIRRSIFVVLMSSDDYVDACERLCQLNLTEIQQREIIRVVLHCCGNERMYNPYYTLVCQQLCRTSHAYKITLQYSLWDFLREIGEVNVGGAAVVKSIKEDDGFDIKSISETRLRNVAKAYAWWLAKDSVTLVVLKPLDFTTTKSRTRDFLRELFTHIFVNSQRSMPMASSEFKNEVFTRNRNAIEEIFIKASRVQTLAMGLVYFLNEAFPGKSDTEDGFSKFLRWSVDVATETLRAGADFVPQS